MPLTSVSSLDRPIRIRDGSLIKTLTQSGRCRDTELLSLGPSGRLLPAHISSRYVDAPGQAGGPRSKIQRPRLNLRGRGNLELQA